MDVLDIILGLDFWYEVNAFISPRHNQLHISDTGGSCVVPIILVPQNGMHLSSMQIIKGFKRGEPTFLATLVGGAKSCTEAVPVPHCIKQVLNNNRVVDSNFKSPGAYQMAKAWEEQVDLARSYLDKAARKMKKFADRKRRPVDYQIGD